MGLVSAIRNAVIFDPQRDAQEKGGTVPLLGHLLWYTIKWHQNTRDELAVALTKNGLPEKFLPPPIFPRDAFRRATIATEAKRIPQSNGRFFNLLMREVKCTREKIIRQLVIEEVDSQNVRLSYMPVAEFTLEDGYFYSQRLIPAWHESTDAIVQAIQKTNEAFDSARKHYDARATRVMVNEMLEACARVRVRPSGGVYFTPARHEVMAGKISNFLKTVSPGSEMWMIPVIDEAKHREMIQNSLETEISDEADAIIAEIEEMNATGTLTARKAEAVANRVNSLQSLADEYSGLLATRSLNAQSRLSAAFNAAQSIAMATIPC